MSYRLCIDCGEMILQRSMERHKRVRCKQKHIRKIMSKAPIGFTNPKTIYAPTSIMDTNWTIIDGEVIKDE